MTVLKRYLRESNESEIVVASPAESIRRREITRLIRELAELVPVAVAPFFYRKHKAVA